jgi:dipeptidyl aminopeptidase/acylaminoacyl peptidase
MLACLLATMHALPLATAATSGGGVAATKPEPRHLILIHGGSFLYGDPSFAARSVAAARASGFVPHLLDYPLGDMPAALGAARAEAARLRARYGRDAVYAYGSSAGGTLAALLAGEGGVAAAVVKAPISDLSGWRWPLDVYGPDYFERIGLGDIAAARRFSPLRRPARAPLLIVHGRRDHVVPLAMSRAYAAKFASVRLWVVEGGHHTERRRPQLLRRALGRLARLSPPQGG